MNYQHPLFIILIGVGTIFILAGLLMKKFPPKTINGSYGYRTSNSMRSKERWVFAQNYSSREMIKWGIVLIALSGLGISNIVKPFIGMVIGLGLMIAICVILRARTEKAINLRFGKD